jgi:hypothetical protein
MGFGNIGPQLWDQPGFLRLSESAQLLYIYLLSGPEASLSVPGLVLCGAQSLAEARRCPSDHITRTLDELAGGKWLDLDPDARLIGVPLGPIVTPPGNTNVVKGWWRRWRDLPQSPVKMRHLEPLRQAICEVRNWTAVWGATFGTALAPSGSLFHEVSKQADKGEVADSKRDYENAVGDAESLSEGMPEAFPKCSDVHSSERAGLKAFESLSKDTRSAIRDPRSEILDPQSEIRREESLSPSQPAGDGKLLALAIGTSPGTQPSKFALARRLWDLQEQLIGDLPYETRTVEPADTDLQLVALALDGYSVEQLEHVQRVFASRAKLDESQAVWFNRRSNWHPAQIERALRMPVVTATKGRVRAAGKKRYGGSAFDTP